MEKYEIEKTRDLILKIGEEKLKNFKIYNEDKKLMELDFDYQNIIKEIKSIISTDVDVNFMGIVITIKFKNTVFYSDIKWTVNFYKKFGYEPLEFNMNKHTLDFTKFPMDKKEVQ